MPLHEQIRFSRASAEALPFADNMFDGAFSVTVLEECNADRAIAEMVRVVKPGGSVAIVVRAIDLPQWWNLDVPEALRAKIERPPQSVGPGGVADRSLYRRMAAAGLCDVCPFPMMITLDNPAGPTWRYREDHILSQLTPEERAIWTKARDASAASGLLVQANAVHAAVGTKPARAGT